MKTTRERLKKILLALLCFLCFSFPLLKGEESSSETVDFGQLEAELFRELNLVRSDPKSYASRLRGMRPFYHGRELRRPGESPLLTQEGVSALAEAIRFMERASPVPRLGLSSGLSRGARDHVEEQGRTGAVGHAISEGSRPHERIARYGSWQRKVGETIVYGCRRGEEAILTFLIDDGVPSRNHRKILMDRDFRAVGIACGPHPVYETLCVLVFAADYQERMEGP